MKTMMILVLILLVAVGVWNSPPRVPSVLFFEAELSAKHDTEFQLGVDADGQPQMCGQSGDVIPWAEYTEGRVKTADEIAKRQAEWAGDKYGNAFLPGASMQDCQIPRSATPPKIEKHYGPKPAEMSLWLQGLNGTAHD